jgi:2-oxoglutarate ferredoxin oxidoreductase subunit alpha
VLAPKGVQDAADLTYEAFSLSEKWRVPVLILADGLIGQMMEGVVLPEPIDPSTFARQPWAVGHVSELGREFNHVTSINLIPDELEALNRNRYARYEQIKKELVRYEEIETEDADFVFVAYGTSARVSHGALQIAREQGMKVGLFRPITLWPFPYARVRELAQKGKKFLCVEMSMGQMIEDVRLAVEGKAPVYFYGRCGGNIPSQEEVFAEVKRLMGK